MEEGNSIEAMGSEEYEDEELTPEPVNTAATVGSPTSGTPRTSTTETSRTAAIKELEEELSSPTMAKTERTTTRSQPHEEAIDDIAMVSDLSRLTFPDEAFPKSDEKKIVTSTRVKSRKLIWLPLKAGMSVDDFLFLHPINSDGQRRSPLRTYRPHVVSVHVLDD
ncbi:hypothetical protein OESDEN_14357 [Oesophagostomum dentatum]|uniref:Uncharacterized protein n=1 Tax=Oesophagostomum dentatum TaxID=61180 RepID=A0A0B1SPS6_OESDE|nr:hypothetical protein OESDEN_14357 [Oesophagostomum dentatum]